MLHKLKRHLIILYTITTSCILFIVLSTVCYININQFNNNSLENFKKLIDNIENKLHNENIINDSWLSQLEIANNLIIHIEDNKTPYLFKGSWNPSSPRDYMIEKAKKAALSKNIDTTVYTIYSDQFKSPVFHLRGKHHEYVYAYVSLIPFEKSYKSLTLIQFRPHYILHIIKIILMYLGLYILGSLALFAVSCLFAGKSLKPVIEGNKRQTEFIAAASHDLRSPLAVIQANASSILVDETKSKQFVPKIIDECSRMSKLIGDMLLLASADSTSWSIYKESIDTETYLIDLYDSLSSLCQKKDHQLYMDLTGSSLPEIYADKDRLTQVLGILIDNAICYSPPKSLITLRPYYRKSIFYIEVEDHGMGIPEEQKEHIFHRFYRTDKSRNDKYHFGLGLSIAKELIELHKGRIYLKDTTGGGSTFIIELPMSAK